MEKLVPIMQPPPGTRIQRFFGDRVRFTVADYEGKPIPKGWQARLRTNLGRAEVLCKEIIQAHTKKLPLAAASWHDVPMNPEGANWSLELPLTEIGYFKAKAYFVDPKGWQHWPDGPDVGISVHPDRYRTGNTIYCAFTRMFGETKSAVSTENLKLEEQLKQLDEKGYSVIPPSGKFRDLIQQLPHIIDTLGCRVLHLLPVNPVPTTYARYGRFGSPYAALDLTAIDPALVEFDQRTTGVDQFRELAYATHLRGARLFLDIVINHTGWGSSLQDEHPEWFLRDSKDKFVSPGAWGTIWEDLVELEHRHVELWDYVAESLLVWCRRGVDGFRCDAGYKVPLPAWQYIIARVRQEYPETLFLLEGLGGAWDLTQQLLTDGGMQWAYSELFQNYSPLQVAGYLDHSIEQSESVGLLVHYSETHDNERLAKRGRTWSLMRNELCALASTSGGFGFTCGVEWLAPEKVNVHSSRGMAWNNRDNIIAELARLNRLLLDHPCFFDGANLTRLSAVQSPVYVLRRDSQEGKDSVLVMVNTDSDLPQSAVLSIELIRDLGDLKFELVGQPLPQAKLRADGTVEFLLEPGACHCLSAYYKPQGLSGEAYRRARAQAAWALAALGHVLPVEQIPSIPWPDLANLVDKNPAAFLAAISGSDAKHVRKNLDALLTAAGKNNDVFHQVVTWRLMDCRRILPVPPQHWLLVEDTVPFRASLHLPGTARAQNQESIPISNGHIVCFAPVETPGDAQLLLERYAPEDREVKAEIRFLSSEPKLDSSGTKPLSISNLSELQDVVATSREVKSEAKAAHPLEQPLVLLTNGIGGMARMCVDLGAVKSKYDCLLGANLHARLPVDRHVFAKRVRVWVAAEGFITPLNLANLASFEPGSPAVWYFIANAGDGRTVEIQITANMIAGSNTTVLHFDRPAVNLSKGNHLPEHCDVRLTVRVDIEDRNFHSETKRSGGADYHFSANTRPLSEKIGFSFTPAVDRQLRVFSDSGTYHHQPEWSENIPHPVEQSRGQTGSGDAYSPGWFDLPMNKGTSVAMVVCADTLDPELEEIQNSKLPLSQRRAKTSTTKNVFPEEDVFGRQLVRAARAFVVRRDDSFTVIAGYPWFLDWGRDSLICARGLLAAGMVEEVKQLLITFGRFAKDGTLPNTIHGEDASNRDTSDAPLWYGIVCEEAAEILGEGLYHTKVDKEDTTIGDVLNDIAMSYIEGTPNGIRMDPYSALIWSPSHFTWMDTNYPAGTPREGYPVEIQVLWIRLLYQLRRNSGQPERRRWRELAEQAQASLQKYFWMEERGYFADLLVAKKGQPAADAVVDNSLRSNYLLAVSLGLVTGEAARRCVDAALRHLVVPGALRTLAPLPVSPPLAIYGANGQLLNNPPEPYWGHYEGDEDTRRKPAYHNGTAWTWPFPIFCEALARAWGNSPEAIAAAKAYLGSMDQLLMNGCVGQLPEILDGDAPHIQRGCDAQAWGATEALRVWKFLHNPKETVIV
ncbi:MAG: glycogen debranching enzyme/alpha-amylase [Pedosphaera sp.]|nr:glycogen debranching enzyme/alpha-amylase [Pedosphaera sp.]